MRLGSILLFLLSSVMRQNTGNISLMRHIVQYSLIANIQPFPVSAKSFMKNLLGQLSLIAELSLSLDM